MSIPTLYFLDSDNFFAFSRAAQQKPATGEYITDALGSVLVSPPKKELPEFHRWQFVDGAWLATPDHRGREGYMPDGKPCKIETWGPLPEGWSEIPPPETLDDSRQKKLSNLNAAFLAAEASGSLTSFLGFVIDATERAKRDVGGLITMLESKGEQETFFCDRDNNMQRVTLAQLKTIQLEIIGYGQQLYAKKWGLREAINAATNLKGLNAIRWDENLNSVGMV